MTVGEDALSRAAAAAARIGGADRVLSDAQVRDFVREQLDGAELDGASVW